MNGAGTGAVDLSSLGAMEHMAYLNWTVLPWTEHKGSPDDTITSVEKNGSRACCRYNFF